MKMWRLAGGMLAGFGTGAYAYTHAKTHKPPTDVYVVPKEAGARRSGLQDYTLDEVRKHNGGDSIWVTFKDGVYDITDFVEAHPGGEKILLAAGGSIEPFWQIYQVHRESSITMDLLESLRIGNVTQEDREKQLKEAASDPYANEPPRHPALEVLSMRPFNAEPPKDLLADSYYTPNETFYVRNHLPVPVVGDDYSLEVKGGVEEKSLTLEYLKKNFEHTTVPATIQCAGNRRKGMSGMRSVDGLMWDSTAISTATWTGVKLSDVLKHVGASGTLAAKRNIKHIVFEGLDGGLDGNYGASISYERAMDPDADVIIAWEMNGHPLPRDHGFPLRVVVPGLVGARSVKWLKSITLSTEESQSIWQQKDYKNIGPSFLDRLSVSAAAKEAPPVREMPVQSAILTPDENDKVKVVDGKFHAKGYAWGGGGRGIQRVDVTVNGGMSWTQAELSQTQQGATKDKYSREGDDPSPRQWAWTLWQADVTPPANQKNFEVCVKAVNSANDTQPESPKGIWNLRGLLNNSWHCVKVEQ
eukprot:TRINITY_DN20994_c0_g1_i2.p1 TRINITY_DN20994_c0_g1~~TRINITY_DN20994_c0_g1_i2.p1  ORF type:complete len:528 (+),score=170.87 TRINITY_DN20994_c0_g1_i2:43-1626(+)